MRANFIFLLSIIVTTHQHHTAGGIAVSPYWHINIKDAPKATTNNLPARLVTDVTRAPDSSKRETFDNAESDTPQPDFLQSLETDKSLTKSRYNALFKLIQILNQTMETIKSENQKNADSVLFALGQQKNENKQLGLAVETNKEQIMNIMEQIIDIRDNQLENKNIEVTNDVLDNITAEESHGTKLIDASLDEEVPTEPFENCSLLFRVKTLETENVTMEEGIRFGNYDKSSRLEYYVPRNKNDKNSLTSSSYSMEFKTNEPDGLIFMWCKFDSIDFETLFMKNGKLYFAYNSGSGPAYIYSNTTFNDNKWHSVNVSRLNTRGTLYIDGKVIAAGKSPGTTKNVDGGNILYIGSIPKEQWVERSNLNILLNIESPFSGCMKNLLLRNNGSLPRPDKYSVEPCTSDVEDGIFFLPKKGYLKLKDKFKVGRTIKISMNIRPRHPSGILLAVHGENCFLGLQMVNGSIKFSVDNGNGVIEATFPINMYDLCNSQWHEIIAVKSKNIVTLQVDKVFTNPGIGDRRKELTNTNDPLYLGGLPSEYVAGLKTTEQYVGCIKNFRINDKPFPIKHDAIIGKVGLHSCPLN